MLDNRLKEAISRFLGDFVESEKLGVHVNLWKSENLRLENVNFKPSILPSWMPFRFKVAHMGELTANIPFSTLGRTPAKVTCSDVLIVLAPKLRDEQDAAEDKAVWEAEKQSFLDQDLKVRQQGSSVVSSPTSDRTKEDTTDEAESEGYYGTNGYVGRLITRLLDNLQIEIKNIHIRFEGINPDMAMQGHDGRYAVGASLDALYAETTDFNWTTSGWNVESQESPQNFVIFKLVQFMNLSFYMDPNAFHLIHTSVHPKVLKASISRLHAMADKATNPLWWETESATQAHRFLLAPISGTLKLTMNTSAKLEEGDRPRYVGKFEVTKFVSSIDEQQIALFYHFLNMMTIHEEWRTKLQEEIRAKENENLTDGIATKYVSLWEHVGKTSHKEMEKFQQSEIWNDIKTLEKLLSLEAIIALRNRSGFSDEAIDSTIDSQDIFYEIGNAFGVPQPEVNVQYAEDSNGVGLKLVLNASKQVEVLRCIKGGQSEKNGLIKPGFILVKINGETIPKKISAADALTRLNKMPSPRVATFRHPEVAPPSVSLNQLVSTVALTTPEVALNMVSGAKRRVILSAALKSVSTRIDGHGPGLFSYDAFQFSIMDFYIQDCWSHAEQNFCLLSSVTADSSPNDDLNVETKGLPPLEDAIDIDKYAALIRINLYGSLHPTARQGRLETYSTHIYSSFRGAVGVFEREKIASVLSAVYQFSDVAFAEPEVNSNNHDTLPQLEVSAPLDLTIEMDIKELQLYIGVPENTKPRTEQQLQAAIQKESYRNILNQLTTSGHQVDMNALQRTWSVEADMCYRAVRTITTLQKRFRGRKVRHLALPSLRNLGTYAYHGWVFKRDDTLAFSRWDRLFAYLDEYGILNFFHSGSAAVCHDSIDIRQVTQMQNNSSIVGPFGSSKRGEGNNTPSTFVLSISKRRDCVLAANSIEGAVIWLERIVKMREVVMEEDIQDRDYTPQKVKRKSKHALSFSDIYGARNSVLSNNSWISMSISNFHMFSPFRYADDTEESAISLSVSASSFDLWDYRRCSTHGVFRIGSTFLDLKGGHLQPIVIGAMNETENKTCLSINVGYRGTKTAAGFLNLDAGLGIELSLSGWILPLDIAIVTFDVLEEVYNAFPMSESNSEKPEDAFEYCSSLLVVPFARLSIRIGLLEVYVEEKSCTAKLSLENDTIYYSAEPAEERLDIDLGPTSLFVLTKKVALRLVKISKLSLEYQLRASDTRRRRLLRSMEVSIGRVKLEADRRMQLLFALLEALSNEEQSKAEDEDSGGLRLSELSSPHNSVYSVDTPKETAFVTTPDSKEMDAAVDTESPVRLSLSTVLIPDAKPKDATGKKDDHSLDRVSSRRSLTSNLSNLRESSRVLDFSINSPSNVFDSRRISAMGTPQGNVNFTPYWPLLCFQYIIGVEENTISNSASRSSMKSIYQRKIPVGNVADEFIGQCDDIVFEVIKRSLSLVALDTYIPVMKMSLSRIRLDVSSTSELNNDFRIALGLEVYARYYNTSLADWEPFVEPWHVHADSLKESVETGIVMQIKAMDRLNINFTESLVKLICSVSKHQNNELKSSNDSIPFSMQNATAMAADAEASRETGRVCVLNNLGIPVRLANLNTFKPGKLMVQMRDGWSLPNYVRYHDVRIDIAMLPWWSPREVKEMESVRHTFSLPYSGAQPGVAPKLRVKLCVRWTPDTAKLYMDTSSKAPENERRNGSLEREVESPTQMVNAVGARSRNKGSVWVPIGFAEIDLVGRLTHNERVEKQWHKIHSKSGALTGEVLIATQFIPDENQEIENATSPAVNDGSYLLFDPLKVGQVHDAVAQDNSLPQVLPSSLRTNYVPPLALEVIMGSESSLSDARNLLCPLRRAGKFLIMGESELLVEVKVAQRDEYRRVVLLSSPVQFKNATSLDLNVWTTPGHLQHATPSTPVSLVKPGSKMSIPLNALYGEEKHLLMLQVAYSEPTLLTAEESLSGGNHLLYLPPLNNQTWGYCFFIETVSQARHVYHEQHLSHLKAGEAADIPGRRATKYQVRVHACLQFENTLPIRIQYELRTGSNTLMRSGTLSPGEEVRWYEFEKDANIFIRLPSMDSEWCSPISLATSVVRDGRRLPEFRVTTPDPPEVRAEDLAINFYSTRNDATNVVFEDVSSEFHLFTGRLDYTVADNGCPRVVLYAALWLYNQSHVPKLLFRNAETSSVKPQIVSAPQILKGRPEPILMDCPSQSFEIATTFDDEVSRWSDKVRATTIGIHGSVSLKSGHKARKSQRKDIAIAVHRPSGLFHRSAQLVITPRYIFVNYSTVEFEVRQVAVGTGVPGSELYFIPSSEYKGSVPFDYSGGIFTQNVSIRPKVQGAKWSGPFSIDDEREFPLRFRGVQNLFENDREMPRIRVNITTVGATTAVYLSEDIPPMFIVRNKSSFDFQLRQARCREKADLLLSGKSMPVAWDKPIGVCEIVGRFRGKADMGVKVSTVHHYDFEQLDKDKGSTILWLGGNKTKTISAEVVVQGMSRVLVFSDQQSRLATRYILEVNVIAVRKSPKESNISKSGFATLAHTENTKNSHIDIIAGGQVCHTDEAKMISHNLYRYDSESVFYFNSRPRELFLNFFEYEKSQVVSNTSTPNNWREEVPSPMLSYTGRNSMPESSPFDALDDELRLNINNTSPQQVPQGQSYDVDFEDSFLDVNSEQDSVEQQASGNLHVKLPKKAWTSLSKGTQRSISDIQGYWWDLSAPDGTLVGQVQMALKFRVSNRVEEDVQSTIWIRAMLPSIGISFVHNTNLLEVAYLSCQRVHFLWSQKGGSNEVALAIGNLQMDNQMDSTVVLGPKSVEQKEGVSVRLRDRWKSCLNYGNRGVFEQVDNSSLNVVQYRMLWNPASSTGITHVELVELIVQELVVYTDEKFVVNLISVFQGLENLSTQVPFSEVVDQSVDYLADASPVSDSIYIEQLDLESIRIKFNFELNGGRHIATLGPSGRGIAVYLPETNVKNLRLYFSKLMFSHVYRPRASIFEQLYRHYQQQAVLMILRGLYTVALYVNPFRIVYRLGNGFLAVVRMPARGLASGSPVELLSGAYLGVRSLAINTIGGGYEIIAGVSGFMGAIISKMLPEHKKKNFKNDMRGFQRTVMDEVDALDAVEEQHMTKEIIRAPRQFGADGIGLLTEYGPGALPKEAQTQVDLRAAMLIQGWWRRRRLMVALSEAASKLRPQSLEDQKKKCTIQ